MPRQGAVQPELDPAVKAQTGIIGLDDVSNGGLARGRLHLFDSSTEPLMGIERK
jgi:hypothetical protein